MSIRPSFKHGVGRLTAAAEGLPTLTRLTQVSHKAPMRLVPVLKSSVDQAGAAVCALSNYGGGMLQGDSVELHVHVKEQARLGVTTQGASRIYTQRVPNLCQATLDATVDPGAMLVWAPDPCSLFRSSSFEQTQRFTIDPTSSVALIDWFSSGRYRNGEHWAFDRLSSRTSLKFSGEETPFLQDAMHLDLQSYSKGTDPLGVSQFHAFASLILFGDQVRDVQRQCLVLSDALMLPHTRIRERPDSLSPSTENAMDLLQSLGLAGRVCMGTSRVELQGINGANTGPAHVVRLAATTNEDLYRIFHFCLHPLHPQFGMEFYKERIRAKASEITRVRVPETQATIVSVYEPAKTNVVKETLDPQLDQHLLPEASPQGSTTVIWSAYMLADSALPTGSFAHSAGLEVAAQMGLISNTEQLETFVQAATRSSMLVTAPFLVSGYQFSKSLVDDVDDMDDALAKWKRLDRQAQAVLASNAPACAASLDQGKSLARVAQQWLDDSDAKERLLQCFQHGSHVGPVLGALAAQLGLSEDQVGHLYGYCVARDMVSAAVRLSLVGPLASVQSLRKIQSAADEGWSTFRKRQAQQAAAATDHDNVTVTTMDPLEVAAASAPVIEAIHPCHESLQVRLFRT